MIWGFPFFETLCVIYVYTYICHMYTQNTYAHTAVAFLPKPLRSGNKKGQLFPLAHHWSDVTDVSFFGVLEPRAALKFSVSENVVETIIAITISQQFAIIYPFDLAFLRYTNHTQTKPKQVTMLGYIFQYVAMNSHQSLIVDG